LSFPVICAETLYLSVRQIEAFIDGNMSAFSGPCDYEPLGIEVMRRHGSDVRRDRRIDNDSD
jgi:hypothetical protein